MSSTSLEADMALTLTCPHCRATRPVADVERGTLVRCAQCGLRTRAPGEPVGGPALSSEPDEPEPVASGGRVILFLLVAVVAVGAGVAAFALIPRHGREGPAAPPAGPAPAAPAEPVDLPVVPGAQPALDLPVGPPQRAADPEPTAGGRLLVDRRAVVGGQDNQPAGVSFTPDGRWLLVSAGGTAVSVLDRRDGSVRGRLGTRDPAEPPPPFCALAVSPDGRTIATDGPANTLVVWDLATGRPRHVLPAGEWVGAAAFVGDGLTLVTVQRGGGVRTWDAEAGRMLAEGPKVANPDEPTVAVTPDGRTVVVGDPAGGLLFLNAETLAVARRVPAHSAGVKGLAVSPDGRTLASVSPADPVVKLFDLPAGTEARTVDVGDCGPTRVAFSPSGRRLAVGGTDLVLIDPAAGQVLTRTHSAGNSLRSLAFSPDGAVLAGVPPQEDGVWLWEVRPTAEARTAAVGKDTVFAIGPGGTLAVRHGGELEVRDGRAGNVVGAIPLSDRGITKVTVGPAGRVALIDDRGVGLWTLADGTARPGPRLPDTIADDLVALAPDGRTVVTAGPTRVRLWDLTADRPKPRALADPPDKPTALAFSVDGHRLAAGLADGSVRLWDVASGRVAWSAPAHEGGVTHVAFSPDGMRLLTAAEWGDRAVRVWDAVAGRELHVLRQQEGITAAAFAANGGLVVTLGNDGRLRAWDAGTGTWVGSLADGPKSVPTVIVAPAGGPFAIESGGQLRVYDPATLRRESFAWSAGTVADPPPASRRPAVLPLRAAVETGNIPHILGQSADGRRLVTTTYLNDINTWELPSGKLLSKFDLPKEAMSAHALSPDARHLAVVHKDATIRVLDAGTGREEAALRGHAGMPFALAFSPDGEFLAVGMGGGADEHDVVRYEWRAGTTTRIGTSDRGIDRVFFSPDGRLLVAADIWERLRVFELPGGRERFQTPAPASAWSAAFSADGRWLVVVHKGRRYEHRDVTVWDVATGRPARTLVRDSKAARWAFFIAPDTVAVGGDDLDCYDMHTGNRVRSVPGLGFVEIRGGTTIAKTDVAGRERINLIDVPRLLDDRFQAAFGPVASAGGRVDVAGPGVTVTLRAQGPDSLAAVKALAGSPEPVRLVLTGDTVPEAALGNLAGARPMVALKIGSPTVRDDWLRHLAGLPLEELDLSGCTRLTDAGLDQLKGLEKLRRLNLGGTGVTSAGRAGLKAARPGIEPAD